VHRAGEIFRLHLQIMTITEDKVIRHLLFTHELFAEYKLHTKYSKQRHEPDRTVDRSLTTAHWNNTIKLCTGYIIIMYRVYYNNVPGIL